MRVTAKQGKPLFRCYGEPYGVNSGWGMNQHVHDWTAEKVQKLKDLQASGLSCAEIAAALGGGLSRSAVIGKLNRLGIKSGKAVKRFWNEENIADLRRLWVQGYSGSAIASRINASSSNAVLNKAQKIGLVARPPKKILRDQHIVRRRPRINIDLKDIPLPNSDFKCTLADLTNDTCRWPLWNDDAETKFYCGVLEADIKENRPYCRWHSVIGTRKYDDAREKEPFRF